MTKKIQDVLTAISQSIFDKKGFNTLILDVRKFSTMTDYFIIAEGNVDRHVKAIGSAIIDKLREFGWKPLHVEGEALGEWIVVDFGEIVIHLFIPELREKYSLEELWRQGKVVDVEINFPAAEK